MNGGPAPPTTIYYRLDANDEITPLDDAWAEFARANGAADLATRQRVPLWSAIADEASRQVWRAHVDRVRTTRVERTVQCRCDGPATKRWLEVRLSPTDEGAILSESSVIREEPRPRSRLLESLRLRRRDDLVPFCGWCARVQIGEDWLEVEEATERLGLLSRDTAPTLTHGICPACFDRIT